MPLQKGVMLAFFFQPSGGTYPGGMYPRNYSIFPTKKGGMLSVFLHPLLGRYKAQFCFRLPAFFVGLEAALSSKLLESKL